MAAKKGSARQRADQFLARIGTAGGAIGSEGLVGFGATDLANQVQSGNIDQYAAIRGGGIQVGGPNAEAPTMPSDLDSSYLKLNLPGSPLGRMALLSPQAQATAEAVQNQIITNEQYQMLGSMPQTGMLPFGLPPATNSRKGNK